MEWVFCLPAKAFSASTKLARVDSWGMQIKCGGNKKRVRGVSCEGGGGLVGTVSEGVLLGYLVD